jgi:SAM-dependent methyltransferase
VSGKPQVYPHVVTWLAHHLGGGRKRFRVLEAGCGGGQYAAAVAPHEWIGFDLPETWYERLRPPSFYGSAEHIPLRDGTFDLVFSVAAFDYFENPARVLAEFYRVLRPGGRCLIFTYDVATLEQIHKNCLALPQTATVRGHHVTGEEDLRRLAETAGFAFVRRLPYMPWSRIKENAIVALRPTNHRTFLLAKAGG